MNKATMILEKIKQDIISRLNLSLFQTGIKPRSLMKPEYMTCYIWRLLLYHKKVVGAFSWIIDSDGLS